MGDASWLKFAILGSTYARALANKAQRTGQPLGPMQSRLQEISQQQRPRIDWTTSEYAKRPGALMPTPEQQSMQQMLSRVPWAGAEHGGTEHAEATYNAMLRRRGHEYHTPGGAQALQQQINQFGPPQRAPEDTYVRKTPYKGQGASPFLLMDEYKVPGKTPMPAQDTRVGPSPAPAAGQAGRVERVAPQGGPIRGSFEQTQVMGPRHGPWERFTAPAGGAVPPPARPRPAAMPQESTTVLKAGAASPLPAIAGIGIPLAVGSGILASKPGIRADIADRFGAPGDIHQKDVAQAIPDEVMGQATRAAQALAERGINPAGLRIAVDAPSGAGKTVLSKALAQQMGLRHHGLDWRPNLRLHQLMGGGDIEKTPYAPHAGEILEHQQLLRSYDPELFDVAIHIHKDPQTIKQQVLKRGRGARTHDLLDYDKSIDVGRKAFETLGGEPIDLGGGVMMKVRPQEGWGNALDQQLALQGIDPTGLTRHQKLLSLHSGRREEHGAGWTPYVKSPFSGAETAAIGASIPLGVLAAKALARR